jgi:hypothetical protein
VIDEVLMACVRAPAAETTAGMGGPLVPGVGGHRPRAHQQ